MKRLIGEYTGTEKGALVIALAAIHGNEPAGVLAMRTLFEMLEAEPQKNPAFQFKGRLIGFIGNIQAYERKIRFVKKDLNRQFSRENIPKWGKPFDNQKDKEWLYEDLELAELMQAIDYEILTYQPEKLIVLDLHTTSASGGIFTLVSEDETSLEIGKNLYAPVVTGFVKGVGGSTLHYFKAENTGIPTTTLAFEGGQHDDPVSIRRTIAWLVNALREFGCVAERDVENRHEVILRGYSKNLPKAVKLIGVHKITPEDHFRMLPDFQNFQPVRKGDVLAYDKNGAIHAPEDCMVLMPLYQQQGTDGFFLVKSL